MITDRCQRWTHGRPTGRPVGELIDPREYSSAAVASDTEAKDFVLTHHYSGSFPAARRRFGLYRGAALVGVAVYSQPWPHVIRAAGVPFGASETLELSRFVLTDAVPGNGESWFLARTFAALRREGFAGVLSFADDCPRTNDAGAVTFPGHLGIIYQATNAVYSGRGGARTLRLLPDGTVLSDRLMTKIRRRERGWRYGVELLRRFGADRPTGCLRQWLSEWRERITRKLRHPGNHRYLWALQRRLRRHLPDGSPYPKAVNS